MSLEAAEMERGGCLIPPRKDAAIEREFRKSYGVPMAAAQYFANSPWLARAVAGLNHRAGQLVHLDVELADLIFLAVSQDNSCRYCYTATRSMLRILGFDDERIRRVEEEASSAKTDPAELCAFNFARRFSRANPAPRAGDWDALRAVGFSDGAIQEIAYMAALTVFSNRIADLPAIPTEPAVAMADRFAVKLLRPLLARFVTRKQRRG